MEINKKTFSYKLFFLIIFLFVALTIWRLYLIFFPVQNLDIQVQIWAASYQIVAWAGAIVGLIFSRLWGGYKSVMGRVVLAFSIGLLAQSFGQSVFSYYFYTGIQAPFPSLADLGFFGSIPFYIYGILTLSKVLGIHISFKSFKNKTQIVVLPVVILSLSYYMFLKGYQFDPTQPLKTFLDFGYPLGQAVYVSLAISVYLLARNIFGGTLKKPITFLLLALAVQYIADYIFLYQSNRGIFVGGGSSDYIYLIAYFTMAIALVYIGNILQKIRSEDLVLGKSSDTGVLNLNELFNKIIVEIIYRQERVAGQIAWETAAKVSGLRVLDQKKGTITLNEDPKKVIDSLITNYKSIFGELAVSVSKEAVRHLVAELPNNEIPVSLK